MQVDEIKEVYEGRVARARVKVIDSGKELTVYGVYMPVRSNKGDRVEEIWEKVVMDITYRGSRKFMINGDFNAETEAWIEKTGREHTKEDVAYQGVIEGLNLITAITEDYTFERADTQIDNILIPVKRLHILQAAYTTTGVREKDHKMVVAELAREVEGVRGVNRPTKRHADKFQEKHWQKYEQILTERTQGIREAMGNKRPSDRLPELQKALTRAAAEVIGEQVGENNGIGEATDKYNRREEHGLNREERRREKSRHELFKWSRHLYHARRYTGAEGNPEGSGDGEK
eukprot:6194971-Pleurochrysis_carterae.AAC.2